MARITLTDAKALAQRGRPWTFRLEFQGANPGNKSGVSAKFWLATGRALNEPVEVQYGMLGAAPVILVKDWAYVEKAAAEKVAKGYDFVDTPFVRVQPSTIARTVPATSAPMAPPLVTPMAPPLVTPMAPPLVTPMVARPPPVVATPPTQAPLVASTLPGPWARVVAVAKQAGTWVGLDSAGTKVLGMTPGAARNLVQNHPHIQVAGL